PGSMRAPLKLFAEKAILYFLSSEPESLVENSAILLVHVFSSFKVYLGLSSSVGISYGENFHAFTLDFSAAIVSSTNIALPDFSSVKENLVLLLGLKVIVASSGSMCTSFAISSILSFRSSTSYVRVVL